MKDISKMKLEGRRRRHARVRAKVSGDASRPRLAVFRSAKHIQAQLIDDAAGRTLAAADDLKLGKKEAAKGQKEMGAKAAAAYAVGHLLAERAKKAGITKAVFDRGGFTYAGRVAALAQGARDGGLEF